MITAISKIARMKDKVHQMLVKEAGTRDSDEVLLCAIWREHTKQLDLKTLTANDFLHMVEKGILPSPESVSRARRLIQADYPNLRGTRYKDKQIQAGIVKDEINNI